LQFISGLSSRREIAAAKTKNGTRRCRPDSHFGEFISLLAPLRECSLLRALMGGWNLRGLRRFESETH
jgi:hypothetical protein